MQDYTTSTSTPPSRPRARGMLFVALLAFMLGAAVVVWAASQGILGGFMPAPDASDIPPSEAAVLAEAPPLEDASALPAERTSRPTPQQIASIGTIEGRLALLEDRLSRIDFKTDAASGNAARAEGLLIAFAARRMVDRGEPLSYVADQLRLRFMNAQPRAVDTVIAFSKNPVTIDELSARLEALSPELSVTEDTQSFWEKASSEIASMFTVRRDASALVSPSARIDRARVMLTARRIGAAVNEVQRLPGADAAKNWIADARRYEDVQKALDLLETTAMLEPRRLKDAEGHEIDQPSPLATPAASGAATTKADAAAKPN